MSTTSAQKPDSQTARLLWQSNGNAIDLLIELDHWETDLEGYRISRRIVPAAGVETPWQVINTKEPLTPYASGDKDLSNVESDPAELEKLVAFNKEQLETSMQETTKEEGWEQMLQPDPERDVVRSLNYIISEDYRLAKLIGLGLTDRSVPTVEDREKVEYGLFPVYKGKESQPPIDSVVVVPGAPMKWPADFHFNVERQELSKRSVLRYSWIPEQMEQHGIAELKTYFRAKGSTEDFQPTSELSSGMPAKGEQFAIHSWDTQGAEYEYSLACINRFGTRGPYVPEGTSTDSFAVEQGPPVRPGVRLESFYSSEFTIKSLRAGDEERSTWDREHKANQIGKVTTTAQVHDRQGKTYIIISHQGNLDKVAPKCLVKVPNERLPVVTSDQMTNRIKDGKLYQFAELTLEEDEEFVVVTEYWSK